MGCDVGACKSTLGPQTYDGLASSFHRSIIPSLRVLPGKYSGIETKRSIHETQSPSSSIPSHRSSSEFPKSLTTVFYINTPTPPRIHTSSQDSGQKNSQYFIDRYGIVEVFGCRSWISIWATDFYTTLLISILISPRSNDTRFNRDESNHLLSSSRI